MRSKGKITTWHDDKGYGFITPFDDSKSIFIHVNAFSHRERRPELGDVVTYSHAKDSRGRPCAAKATLPGQKLRQQAPRRPSKPAIFFALSFLTSVGASFWYGSLPVEIFIFYAAISLITYFAYALDKSAAKRRRASRTPESTLQFLGLLGGWPGALIAQQTLRHKSKKTSFRIMYWATVLMNCAALIWLHTVAGREFLERLFR